MGRATKSQGPIARPHLGQSWPWAVFFLCGFSDVAKVAIMIQKKYLAKFGYKQDMHVKSN
jgi:hypothetical protein